MTWVISRCREHVVLRILSGAPLVHCWLSDVYVALVEFLSLAVPAGLAAGAEAGVVGVDGGRLALQKGLVVSVV